MKTQTDPTKEQQNTAAPKVQKEVSTGGTTTITDNRPSTIYQRKLRETMNASTANKAFSIQKKANNTGLPNNLKTGIENLSGYTMDDVKVHYNSNKPAQLQAHAYAQGSNIHLAPGQEKHLPHEAWHVVQQKQGRVKPTMQLKGKTNINDDAGLEKEADVMGMKALHNIQTPNADIQNKSFKTGKSNVIQRAVGFEFEVNSNIKTHKLGKKEKYESLNKKDRIVEGDDFYVEADGLPKGKTSWEFVTVPFPETAEGLKRLIIACENITGILGSIKNTPERVMQPVDDNFLNGFGTPVDNRYFIIEKSQPIIVKPQVTAGFSLSALDKLFHSASVDEGVDGTSNLIRDMNDFTDRYKKNPGNRMLDTTLGAMRTSSIYAIKELGLDRLEGVSELTALLTYLVQVIIGGMTPILATPKTLLRLVLARTDLATVYSTLPQAMKDHFQTNEQEFVNVVMLAASHFEKEDLSLNQPVISKKLFTEKMYKGDPKYKMKSPFKKVSRKDWLLGIIQGTDLLSQGNYPVRKTMFGNEKGIDKKANTLLDSMGGLHDQLDIGDRPVFEIRSSKEIYAGFITPFAIDFFNYVSYLNGLKNKESNYLTGLSGEQQSSLGALLNDHNNILTRMGKHAQDHHDPSMFSWAYWFPGSFK